MKSISLFTLGLFGLLIAQACLDIGPMEIPISLDIPGKFTYTAGGEVQVLEKDRFLSTNNCQYKPNPSSFDAQWILSGSRILYRGGCPQNEIHILDPSSGNDQFVIERGNNGAWYDAAANLIGQRIAVLGQKMLTVYQYDGLSLQKIDSIATNWSGRSLSLSPDGETVLIFGNGLHIHHVGKDSLFAPAGDFFHTGTGSWSNQSDQFAFDGSLDIYVSDHDGKSMRNLTNTPDEHETSPAWSPVADELVFVRSFPYENRAELVLYDLKQNTGDVIFSHDDFVDIQGLQWSQDGSKIAFYNHAASNGGIYMIDRSGSELTRYTRTGWQFDWIYP